MEVKHSAEFIRLANDSTNFTEMPEADGRARVTGSCGDTVEI